MNQWSSVQLELSLARRNAVAGDRERNRHQIRRNLPPPAQYDRRVIRWSARHPGRSWLSEGFVAQLERDDSGRTGW